MQAVDVLWLALKLLQPPFICMFPVSLVDRLQRWPSPGVTQEAMCASSRQGSVLQIVMATEVPRIINQVCVGGGGGCWWVPLTASVKQQHAQTEPK